MSSITNADLVLMSQPELKKLAEGYKVKSAQNMNREQLLEAVQLAAIRSEEDLRQKVTQAKIAESLLKIGCELNGKKRPAPETIAILASRKVRVRFLNREDSGGTDGDGADIVFLKGPMKFHLWDGKEHILPECLIIEREDQIPDVTEKVVQFFSALGLKKEKATDAAKGVMKRLSLQLSCLRPQYGNQTLPGGEVVSAIIGWSRRFEFVPCQGPIPDDAEFGVIESEVLQHA